MDEHLANGSPPGAVWGAAAGIVVTAAVSLWRGRRSDQLEKAKAAVEKAKASGDIETSDAGEVWAARAELFNESERIRHELRDEVDRLRAELVEVRTTSQEEIGRLRAELVDARSELVDCRTRVSTLEPTVRDLTARLQIQEDR